tara:strand:- start:5747 stop:6577 length:831 start_codon:yes stop_codon:yes gene_type:complete
MKTFAGGIILAALLLQACATQDVPSRPEAAAEAPSVYTPEPGLSDKARFRQALLNLEAGDPVAARAELVLYLDSQPGSEVGQDLLQQIDLPADEYFPPEYREIPLEPGWSLSTVAQRYLGSVYRFHALAKYNGISEPRKLHAGKSLRIPLTAQALAAFNETDAGQDLPLPTGDLPDELAAEPGIEQPLPELPVAAAEPSLPDEAASADAIADATAVNAQRAEGLHREALNAYRAQDLDSAIALWDEALALDPEHPNAMLYRSQAIDLKRKLSDLAN